MHRLLMTLDRNVIRNAMRIASIVQKRSLLMRLQLRVLLVGVLIDGRPIQVVRRVAGPTVVLDDGRARVLLRIEEV